MALEGGERVASSFQSEPIEELTQEEKALLAKPISDLNLSVRARKCMNKLGIQTVGELIIHTGDELMECKNFGVTSLNEVRERLGELGLKLKNE
jgi:DNA-directed RNA polymerase subunit alpha